MNNYEKYQRKSPMVDPWARNCNSFILVEVSQNFNGRRKI